VAIASITAAASGNPGNCVFVRPRVSEWCEVHAPPVWRAKSRSNGVSRPREFGVSKMLSFMVAESRSAVPCDAASRRHSHSHEER
jgi:hypothetical protein